MNTEMNVVFFGRVQQVGFRFNTRKIAQDYLVSGWVKNMPDGTVEMLAQGEKIELERFLNRIKTRFFNNIDDIEVNWRKPVKIYSGFQITY